MPRERKPPLTLTRRAEKFAANFVHEGDDVTAWAEAGYLAGWHARGRAERVTKAVIGKPTSLAMCPIGLFLCDDELCLKTEYSTNEGAIKAFIVSSGEYFWGPAPQTIQSQRATTVYPVKINLERAKGRK